MQKITKQLLKVYGDAPVAEDTRAIYQIWAQDSITGHDRFKVEGEKGFEWTEMVEVADYFNAERDGYTYYIGDDEGNPLRPSYGELQNVVQGHRQNAGKWGWSYPELLAFALLIGGDWTTLLY